MPVTGVVDITHRPILPAHATLKMSGEHAFIANSITIGSIRTLASLDPCVQCIIMQHVRDLRKIAQIYKNIHWRLSIFDFRQQDLIDFASTATTKHATRQEVLHNFMQLMLDTWQRECKKTHDTHHSTLCQLMENIMHLLFSRLIHVCVTHCAISETHSRYHETCTNSPNNKNILASRDATAEKLGTIDQLIQTNFDTIRSACQIYGNQHTNSTTTSTEDHNRIESLVYFHKFLCARDKWGLVAMPPAPLFLV